VGPRRPPNLGDAIQEQQDAALIENRFKLHQFADNHFELYDITADPGEAKDLAGEKPEVVTKMVAAMQAWQLSVERSLMGHDYAAPPATKR
jgi:hypothetical protein